MTEFIASNGHVVDADADSAWVNNNILIEEPGDLQALREFFQHERDEELGRWRWPENPDYVVYPRGDAWLVLSERSGTSKHYSRREHADVGTSVLSQAMRAYFEAHPEPKPWHGAKPGEVWLLTIDGREEPALLYRSGEFETPTNTYSTTARCIKSARRIYPESD